MRWKRLAKLQEHRKHAGDFVVGGSLGVVLKLSQCRANKMIRRIGTSMRASRQEATKNRARNSSRPWFTGDYDNGKTISENKTNTLFQVDETKSVRE